MPRQYEHGQASGSRTSGENLSYWLDTSPALHYEALQHELSAEVLIIGGGIAGLTTAYALSKAGRQVVLVEDGNIGSGESGRTTAHITHALDDRYFLIEDMFGEEDAHKVAASHTAAIDWIESAVAAEGIDCHFRRVPGYLFIHPTDSRESLEKEFHAAQRAGLPVRWLDSVPHLQAESGPCIEFPRQGQFHIMMYLEGLAGAIVRMGGRIFTGTHARHVSNDGAVCNGYQVKAQQIVVATNSPINDFAAMHTKQAPFRTYVIAGKIPKGTLPAALWWDTGDQGSKWFVAPYHYARTEELDGENDVLIIGGEDHKTGQADAEGIPEQQRYDALIEWSRKRFPMLQELSWTWSGQVMETMDYLGYLGRNPGDDNIYIITGDSGNGMTHGTLGGMIISDLILGLENPWAALYSPGRIPLKKAGVWLSQNVDVMAQYADFIKGADIAGFAELPAGEGAILGKGLNRFAVYRDEAGAVHVYSAVCPHMGCVVRWNGEEKTFDCPCHGSRFTRDGVVINGPATAGLSAVSAGDIG
jgi:glycine/D-amino acid oxidase-like deaminating enzyme/nitrite reductase/ring-hydroxylating ferredoxin subunit